MAATRRSTRQKPTPKTATAASKTRVSKSPSKRRPTRAGKNATPAPNITSELIGDHNDELIEHSTAAGNTTSKSRSAGQVAVAKGRAARSRTRAVSREMAEDAVAASPFGNITGNAVPSRISTRSLKSVTPAPSITVNSCLTQGGTIEIPEQDAKAIGDSIRVRPGTKGITKSPIFKLPQTRRSTRKNTQLDHSSSKDLSELPQQEGPAKKSRVTRAMKSIKLETNTEPVVDPPHLVKKTQRTRTKKSSEIETNIAPIADAEEVSQGKEPVKVTHTTRATKSIGSEEPIVDPSKPTRKTRATRTKKGPKPEVGEIPQEKEPVKKTHSSRGKRAVEPEIVEEGLQEIQKSSKETRATRCKKITESRLEQLEQPVTSQDGFQQQETARTRTTCAKKIAPEQQLEPIRITRGTRFKKNVDIPEVPEELNLTNRTSREKEATQPQVVLPAAEARNTRGKGLEVEPKQPTQDSSHEDIAQSAMYAEDLPLAEHSETYPRGRKTSPKSGNTPEQPASESVMRSVETPTGKAASEDIITIAHTMLDIDNANSFHQSLGTPSGEKDRLASEGSITVAQNSIPTKSDTLLSSPKTALQPSSAGSTTFAQNPTTNLETLPSLKATNKTVDITDSSQTNHIASSIPSAPTSPTLQNPAKPSPVNINNKDDVIEEDESEMLIANEGTISNVEPTSSGERVSHEVVSTLATDVEGDNFGDNFSDNEPFDFSGVASTIQGPYAIGTPEPRRPSLPRDPVIGTPLFSSTPMGVPVTPNFSFGSPLFQESFPNSPALPIFTTITAVSSQARSPIKSPAQIASTPIKVFSPATGATPKSIRSIAASSSKSLIMDDAQNFTHLSPATSDAIAGDAMSPVKQSSPHNGPISSPLGMTMPSSPPKRSHNQISTDSSASLNPLSNSNKRARRVFRANFGEASSPLVNSTVSPLVGASNPASPAFSPVKRHDIPTKLGLHGMDAISSPVRSTRQSALFAGDEPSRLGTHEMAVTSSPAKRSPKLPPGIGSKVKQGGKDNRPRPVGFDSLFDDTYSLSPVRISPQAPMLDEQASAASVTPTNKASSTMKALLLARSPSGLSPKQATKAGSPLNVPSNVRPRPVGFDSLFDDTYSLSPVRISHQDLMIGEASKTSLKPTTSPRSALVSPQKPMKPMPALAHAMGPGSPQNPTRPLGPPPSKSPKRRLSYIAVPQAGEEGPSTPPAKRLRESIEVAPDTVSRRRYGRRVSLELLSMANEPTMEAFKAQARGHLVRRRLGVFGPSPEEGGEREEGGDAASSGYGVLGSFLQKQEKAKSGLKDAVTTKPASKIPKLAGFTPAAPEPPSSPSTSGLSSPLSPPSSPPRKRKAEGSPSPRPHKMRLPPPITSGTRKSPRSASRPPPTTSLAPVAHRPSGHPTWETMLERERKGLVKQNTKLNCQPSAHERQVERRAIPRPPSPTAAAQTRLAIEGRRKRKAHFLKTGVELGPGEGIGFRPKALTPPKKGVRWGAPLEAKSEVHSPSGARQLRAEASLLVRKGDVALDRFGNVEEGAAPTEERISSPVIIRKVVYRGESV